MSIMKSVLSELSFATRNIIIGFAQSLGFVVVVLILIAMFD